MKNLKIMDAPAMAHVHLPHAWCRNEHWLWMPSNLLANNLKPEREMDIKTSGLSHFTGENAKSNRYSNAAMQHGKQQII